MPARQCQRWQRTKACPRQPHSRHERRCVEGAARGHAGAAGACAAEGTRSRGEQLPGWGLQLRTAALAEVLSKSKPLGWKAPPPHPAAAMAGTQAPQPASSQQQQCASARGRGVEAPSLAAMLGSCGTAPLGNWRFCLIAAGWSCPAALALGAPARRRGSLAHGATKGDDGSLQDEAISLPLSERKCS